MKNEVQRAIAADEDALTRLCGNYIDNVKAYTQREKVKNKYTGQTEEPDERLMRSIEEKIDIPESRKDDFRREIMNYIGALSLDGKKFDYKTNERLQKALELKLFQDQKDTIKLTSLVSSVVDKDTQEKIDIVKGRLIRNYGYDEDSATDVLNYVASIFARGDVKRGQPLMRRLGPPTRPGRRRRGRTPAAACRRESDAGRPPNLQWSLGLPPRSVYNLLCRARSTPGSPTAQRRPRDRTRPSRSSPIFELVTSSDRPGRVQGLLRPRAAGVAGAGTGRRPERARPIGATVGIRQPNGEGYVPWCEKSSGTPTGSSRSSAGKIKDDLRKYITHGEMIGKTGGELVSIPLPQIDLPEFRYGSKNSGGRRPGARRRRHADRPLRARTSAGEAGDAPATTSSKSS